MATPVPIASDAPPRVRAASVEERYRTLFVVGRGGMGAVEVALERGEGGFERIVALKRMLPESARDPRHKEMFLREARLAALLSHPNVVHAFAFGELYGELFLAMEYVEGETLSRALSVLRETGGAIDAALAAHVLAQVCDGLHAAHELRDVGGHPLNVVHRDVSPHNVMLSYEGHVKLLDFGVAKFDTGGHETRTGEVKGKMAYMSPEQALGDKLDRRSDLFSVGAVLFECVAGRRMWGAGTDVEVMRKIALEDPPRLDDAAPGSAKALADLHARLVARDPAMRPATAREVAEELRAIAAACDAGAVRALMVRAFGADAEKRRATLTASLAEAAPSRVEELRRSLEWAIERPTITEPIVVRAPVEESARRSRAAWVVGAVVAIAGAIGVAAYAARGARGDRGTGTVTATATVTATTTAAGNSAALPATSASTSTSTPTPTSTPASTPTLRPRVASSASAKPAAPAVSGRLPHVDPTPF